MSDFVGNQIRYRRTEALIDELVRAQRALTLEEVKLLAFGALHWRHLAAHFDAKVRGTRGVPYVDREIELRPDAECPLCGQNVHVSRIPGDDGVRYAIDLAELSTTAYEEIAANRQPKTWQRVLALVHELAQARAAR